MNDTEHILTNIKEELVIQIVGEEMDQEEAAGRKRKECEQQGEKEWV